MTSKPFTEQLHRETYSPLHYFPLLSSPALLTHKYAVDERLILARTISGFALSLIAAATLYWICPPIALLATKYTALAACGFTALSLVPGMIEVMRAQRAADQLAAEEYDKKTVPLAEATQRLARSPRAFQYLLDRKANLLKLDSLGRSVADRALFPGGENGSVRQMLLDSDIDFLKVDAEKESLFMQAVACPGTVLRYLLESGKVQAKNINEQDQAAIWKQVRYADTVKLLCQYGFNINARDAEGNTALIYWIKEERDLGLAFFIVALNKKANPLLENSQGQKASQLAPEKSFLRSLLLQAEKEFGKDPRSLPKEQGLMAWLPWKPWVRKTGEIYEADFDALVARAYKVFIVTEALALFIPYSISAAAFQITTCINIVSFPFHFIIELWRGAKEAKRQAVVEYLKKPIPSTQSTATICRSITAAHLLIEHAEPHDLDKRDGQGERLLSKQGIDLEVFKLLVDHGADILAGNLGSGFFLAVNASRPDFLAYILDRKLVKIQDLSPELQVKMWLSIGSEQIARHLKDYGFDPDVRDAEGNTPLMLLAQKMYIEGEIPSAKIQALLAAGADRHLVNRAGKTAKELSVWPEIANFL